MLVYVFFITVTAELLSAVAVIWSIACPGRRIWPPPREHAWEQQIMATLFLLSAFGSLLLGILDWDKFILPTWIRFGLGGPLWFLGMALGIWSMIVLGLAQSSGRAKGLIRGGSYRFSRNPQYIGFIFGLAGWGVMANSAWMLIAAFFGILPLLLVPFAEEPWLLDQYGAEFAQYMRMVPRFFIRW